MNQSLIECLEEINIIWGMLNKVDVTLFFPLTPMNVSMKKIRSFINIKLKSLGIKKREIIKKSYGVVYLETEKGKIYYRMCDNPKPGLPAKKQVFTYEVTK